MSNNYKDILADVKKLKEEDIHKIYVPSTGKKHSFTSLTVKQQKDLIAAGLDMNVENLSFSNLLNKIITDTCRDTKLTVLSVDRPLIILQLRQLALGDTLVIDTEDDTCLLYTSDAADE